MQKRSAARSAPARRSLLPDLSLTRRPVRQGGFLSPRVAIALPLCAAACSLITGTLLGFLHSDATPKIPQRTLTFQERVAYQRDRKSTRLNSSHTVISYAVFCLKKKKKV